MLWCWRRLLRVPWTARRSNQSIIKEISPKCSLERLMLKLKLQYFGHMMWRTDSLEKTLLLGKTEGRRRKGRQRMRWLDGSPLQWTWVWVNSRSWWWTGGLACCSLWGCKELDMTEWLNWCCLYGEGNGNPLQCSCLENLRDGGAWCTAVYGVMWSRTWLKRLSSSSSSCL